MGMRRPISNYARQPTFFVRGLRIDVEYSFSNQRAAVDSLDRATGRNSGTTCITVPTWHVPVRVPACGERFVRGSRFDILAYRCAYERSRGKQWSVFDDIRFAWRYFGSCMDIRPIWYACDGHIH